MLIELAGVNTLNCSIKARRIFLCRSGIFREFKRIEKLQFSIVMHLEKLLLKSFTSNYFNAVLLPCTGPFKLIEVDVNITTSLIAALLSCSSGFQVQIILLNFLSVHVNCSLYGHWK